MFPNMVMAELRCIRFCYHASFMIYLLSKYPSSGVFFQSRVAAGYIVKFVSFADHPPGHETISQFIQVSRSSFMGR